MRLHKSRRRTLRRRRQKKKGKNGTKNPAPKKSDAKFFPFFTSWFSSSDVENGWEKKSGPLERDDEEEEEEESRACKLAVAPGGGVDSDSDVDEDWGWSEKNEETFYF